MILLAVFNYRIQRLAGKKTVLPTILANVRKV